MKVMSFVASSMLSSMLGGKSIALRLGLLSWLVAISTLLVFVLLTIPQQKKTFRNNLESKAKSVAVSLHDAVAGAAINEDYASVISASQTMLAGDPDVEFLIVMKNEGFAMVIEPKAWRVEPQAGPYWLPQGREAAGAISKVPLLDRRVFHYAEPFDYSGIQWGWIHVGLSLNGYDHNVAALYSNTVLLGIGCTAFSLLISLLYAQRLVQPIVQLRGLVGRIAGGDLSVRANMRRQDELGSLAESVNIMAEALSRRDRILESVRFAAQHFMAAARWEDAIQDVLGKISLAADASRAYIFRNYTDAAGSLLASQQYEWTAPGISAHLSLPEFQAVSSDDPLFAGWAEKLRNEDIVCGPVSEMSAGMRTLLAQQSIRSLILIPIFVAGDWWGVLGLDDCVCERIWTEAEKDSLRAGVNMLGATIVRQRAQEELLEAKVTLEDRVLLRTEELRLQVAAKEQALADLAAVQGSLVEMSRQAGMAEVATGVLHNVGNVLNSVNVSCTLMMDQLRQSRVENVARVAGLLDGTCGDPGRFLNEDERGRKVPAYLTSLAAALRQEHDLMSREAESLHGRVEHIKEIVAMQQNYGRVSGVSETITAERLLEDALKLNAGALVRHGVEVERCFEQVSPLQVEKHKVLQILLNLVNNAKYACSESAVVSKRIVLRIFARNANRVVFEVSDNGIGIAPENLTRIFQHGFTTRKSGHGFGLHSGALAARELGGSLTVRSDGPGHGATFTLDLPCKTGGRA